MASTRRRYTSPTLNLEITEEDWQKAKLSKSGGCLIAEAIKRQYPHLSRVNVDMATIRATDRARGERYFFLSPESAQFTLLSLDQGWRQPVDKIVVKRAVKIIPITRSSQAVAVQEERRQAQREELETKVEAGETLTTKEKARLTKLKKPTMKKRRPASRGKAQSNRDGVISGGDPLRVSARGPHPNLLAGRNRHYGAKLSHPGVIFQEAVDLAVEQRLQEMS